MPQLRDGNGDDGSDRISKIHGQKHGPVNYSSQGEPAMSRRHRPSIWSRAIPAALALVFALTFPALSTRDGNGGYSLPSNSFSVPVTGGTLIASEAAAVWADITTAIAGSVAADGQTTMSGNLKMGAQRITGLAEGTAATDATTVNQIQDGAMRWGGVAGGTADALTMSLSPVVTAYVDGMTIYFVSSASPNTGAATVNVNSVATDAILKNGSALAAGDIAASKVYAITYYNSDWHLWSPLNLSGVALLASANTFTAAQAITTATTGALLSLQSTEAGAVGGPNVDFYRNSATPAANDVLGGFTFNGEDSAGNTTEYANVTSVIVDPTDTTEDGRLRFVTMAAGSSAARFNVEAGMYGVGATGGDKGAGTVNALGVYVNGHGTVAQVVTDTDTANTTLGTILPYDNSIPQNTEGDEVLSVAITPVNASSVLYIDVAVNIGTTSSATEAPSCAIFVDSTAGALAAGSAGVMASSADMSPIYIRHSLSAASTSARTYKVRCGNSAAADAFLNGHSTSRIFGGVAVSSLTVTEVLPQ
jgi:hypothetical protein